MTEAFAQLHALLEARSSTRGFTPEPLPEPTLRQLLEAAQRAPSWCNVQPWRVVITSPPTTARVVAALVAAAEQRCHKSLLPYGLLDLGVWLGTLLPAAQALGIATCPMASVVGYPQVLRAELPISSEEVLAFGLALGIADPAVPANAARTSRELVDANLTFV